MGGTYVQQGFLDVFVVSYSQWLLWKLDASF
jgi:hypothetical protein